MVFSKEDFEGAIFGFMEKAVDYVLQRNGG